LGWSEPKPLEFSAPVGLGGHLLRRGSHPSTGPEAKWQNVIVWPSFVDLNRSYMLASCTEQPGSAADLGYEKRSSFHAPHNQRSNQLPCWECSSWMPSTKNFHLKTATQPNSTENALLRPSGLFGDVNEQISTSVAPLCSEVMGINTTTSTNETYY